MARVTGAGRRLEGTALLPKPLESPIISGFGNVKGDAIMTGIGWLRVAAVLGFLGVAIGAFGAHGLKERLEALGTSATFQTGVHYHFYHTFAMLAVGLIFRSAPVSMAGNVAGWGFLVGVVIFSGSLYVLATTGIRWLGAITPFGGVAFLIGWAALAVAANAGNPLIKD